MSVNILLNTTSEEIAPQNSTANANFIDAVGNKTDETNNTAGQASLYGLLRYLEANLPDSSDITGLIGSLTTIAATGAVGTTTTVMGYIKQLVTDLRTNNTTTGTTIPALIGTPVATLATDIAAIKTVVDLIKGYTDTEVAAIKLVTDLLPDAGALTSLAQASTLLVPTADVATNTNVAQVIGNKSDTIAGTSLVALTKQLIAIVNGTTANTNAIKREAGRTQIKKVAIISAANAGLVTLATVTTQTCLIKSISLRCNSAASTDLTSAAIKGGASQVVEFISSSSAIKSNIDAVDEQVGFTGNKTLSPTATIVVDLQGTGATPVDLVATIEYVACVDGGYLA